MKNYILPALISLALISPCGLAEESPSVHEHPAVAPSVTQPTSTDAEQIRALQRQNVQELMRKIQEVQDPVERQRLTVAHIQDMQQHLQEMQMMLGQSNPPMPGGTYPGPHYGYPPIYGAGPPSVVYLANGGYAPPNASPSAEGKKKECDMKKKMKEKTEEGGHEGHGDKPETSDDAGPSLTKIEQSLARIIELLEKNFAEQKQN